MERKGVPTFKELEQDLTIEVVQKMYEEVGIVFIINNGRLTGLGVE